MCITGAERKLRGEFECWGFLYVPGLKEGGSGAEGGAEWPGACMPQCGALPTRETKQPNIKCIWCFVTRSLQHGVEFTSSVFGQSYSGSVTYHIFASHFKGTTCSSVVQLLLTSLKRNNTRSLSALYELWEGERVNSPHCTCSIRSPRSVCGRY